ncbi:PfkB protein [Catenovulum agarivorans DS-2]|uniref:PfkB protein n=1 Tax=Catenovulum agarivorans DS-2 TaxID=1328313 RepID=W7QJJ2_9ALTE|nr:carbohydrate kinase [Catenovulum agarivorans]EWH08318.1 PfkB protein [Catenovulum agarivorans DS-2]
MEQHKVPSQQNVAVFGEALIDLIEQPDGQFQPYIGGSPFNVALAMARFGLASHYLAPISTDEMGLRIKAYAEKEQVILPTNISSNRNTSLALVYKDANGQPDYSLYRSLVADLDISVEKLTANLPSDLKVFHTGSLALRPEMATTLTEVFGYLTHKNINISIDINMRKCIPEEESAYIASVKQLMLHATYLKVSDEDLDALGANGEYLAYCQQLLHQGNIKLIAFTQGADGATLLTANQNCFLPAITPAQLADTVGAGDTYFAAMLAYLVRNQLISVDAADFTQAQLSKINSCAAIAASINVSRHGCNPPNFAEVTEFAQCHNMQV